MAKISAEISHNYDLFSQAFPKKISENAALSRGKDVLLESYARIAALNSFKVDLISQSFSKGAEGFFIEAHNDALLSHVSASFGSWRSALQSLRSLMENTMSAIYFADHPIELQKWEKGDFKLSPKELKEYCSSHPRLEAINKVVETRAMLDAEYATLSKAVHASNTLFRMTSKGGKTNIGTYSEPELGKWSTRERAAINICTILLISIFQDQLDGAKRPQLRRALSFALSTSGRKAVKEAFNIMIPAP